MTMGGMSHLKLVSERPDQDVIDILEDLLELARAGKLPGFAYVALHKGTGYSADVIGTCRQHPLFALGVCDALKLEIAAQTRRKL